MRLDLYGALLIAALALLATLAATAAIAAGYVTLAGLALFVVIGVGFVGFAPANNQRSSLHNTYAHGAARLADEDEARAAAMRRGASKPLDAMDFND